MFSYYIHLYLHHDSQKNNRTCKSYHLFTNSAYHNTSNNLSFESVTQDIKFKTTAYCCVGFLKSRRFFRMDFQMFSKNRKCWYYYKLSLAFTAKETVQSFVFFGEIPIHLIVITKTNNCTHFKNDPSFSLLELFVINRLYRVSHLSLLTIGIFKTVRDRRNC